MLKESEKMPLLQKLLNDLGDKIAIVFCNKKKTVDSHAMDLDKLGYCVTTLHSDKSQEQREISLEGFKNRRFNVLVATDIAGRGRAGKTGVATTFLTLQDTEVFYDLKQMLIQSKSLVPPELAGHEASKFKPGMIPNRPPKQHDMVFFTDSKI